jgi:hypothetical protein
MNCYKFWKFKGISGIFKQINVFGKRKFRNSAGPRIQSKAFGRARPGPVARSAQGLQAVVRTTCVMHAVIAASASTAVRRATVHRWLLHDEVFALSTSVS